MSEVLAKQFGNFIDQFMEYDTKAAMRNFQNHMRIRVRIDIRQPLC
ncbi:hypothetical protein Godav_002109 [Gossypium davidsonii]|uniref:Uncharacterized protein n=1 Tax=Gossypium davidsonii TaxID=34287 RepID=A0A7J8SV27_GOSDV|nr:hypothetical protein [Gossypium davidsonii]